MVPLVSSRLNNLENDLKTVAKEKEVVYNEFNTLIRESGTNKTEDREDLEKNPYISIIMGAEDKSFLYQEMNRLLEAGETTKTE